jgi:2,4-dienoyl-CoA reductase-like NADH-dependent reductase (Old Yellow Enzyme family)
MTVLRTQSDYLTQIRGPSRPSQSTRIGSKIAHNRIVDHLLECMVGVGRQALADPHFARKIFLTRQPGYWIEPQFNPAFEETYLEDMERTAAFLESAGKLVTAERGGP